MTASFDPARHKPAAPAGPDAPPGTAAPYGIAPVAPVPPGTDDGAAALTSPGIAPGDFAQGGTAQPDAAQIDTAQGDAQPDTAQGGVAAGAAPPLDEHADAPDDTGTPYRLTPQQPFSGLLGPDDPRDRVAVTLQAGMTYDFAMLGAPSGAGTLRDPYLRLYEPDGRLVAQDDDGGHSVEAALTFTATRDGVHFLSAGSYRDAGSGSYRLTMQAEQDADPLQPGSIDDLATFLLTREEGGARSHWAEGRLSVDLSRLTAEGQGLARAAMQAWEMVADIRFDEVPGGDAAGGNRADITVDDEQAGAFASWSGIDGRLTWVKVNVSRDWLAEYGTTLDSFSFSTYVHEFGHALGLGHMGHYNGSARFPRDATFLNDSYQLSVMSYFSQDENSAVIADHAEPVTAMLADIVAVQRLHGTPDAASSPTAGDTVWGGAGASTGTYLDTLFAGWGDTANPVAFTLYDVSGRDRIDLSASVADNRLDLRAEQVSDLHGLIGNMVLARGTVVEDATLGAGDDHVTGNAAANLLTGHDGADTLLGEAGDDTLYGGAGDDRLEGGDGGDLLGGGAGADTLLGGDGQDALYGSDGDDRIEGGAGDDTLGGADGNDRLFGEAGHDRVWTAAGDDHAEGGAGDDNLGGAGGADTLLGGPGDDSVWGADGHDSLEGGAGRDLIGGAAGDDTALGGDGADTIWGAAGDDRLSGGAEDDRMGGGQGADSLSGEAGADTLFGGAGDDTLLGGTGDDLIFAAAGDDSIDGGAGDDTIYVGSGADILLFGPGGGSDRILFFSLTEDRLSLDSGLWGTPRQAAHVVADFGRTSGADYLLDFGPDTLTLVGHAGATGLDALIDIV